MADDAQDAAKWRALMACYRITCMGSAGLMGTFKETGYAHATFNLWTCRGPGPEGATGDAQDQHGRERFERFVAIAVDNHRNTGGSNG